MISSRVLTFTVSDNKIFAGTDGAGVFVSENSGISWIKSNSGLRARYGDVLSLVFNGSNLYAGTFGWIFSSTNNGLSWNPLNDDWGQYGYVTAMAADGSNIFAGTDSGGVFFSNDNGASWNQRNVGLTDVETGNVPKITYLVSISTNIFAGTDSRGVYISTNNGASWLPVNNGLANKNVNVLAFSDTDLFAGTEGGGLFRSVDNGKNWTAVNTGLTHTIIRSIAINGTKIFAGTGWGGVFLSVNNGNSWTPVNTGLMNLAAGALAVSGPDLFAGVYSEGVWRRPLSEMHISVTVTAPYGGENWRAGSTEFLFWNSSNIQNVKIEYSLNGGADWLTIVNSTPAGSAGYPWSVPDTASDNCLVRISDVLDPGIYDISNDPFTIYQPSLVLTAPNGCENWKAGSIDTITWIANHVQNVKIEYSANGGGGWSTVISTMAAVPSSYHWTIPDTSSTDCLVKISDVQDVSIFDVSDSCFSIETLPVGIIFTENVLPIRYNLRQNVPNPFNPSTKIEFALPKPEFVKIEVYNLKGQKIETLLAGIMPAGCHKVEFNGQGLASGIYLYRIETASWQDMKKMVLLK